MPELPEIRNLTNQIDRNLRGMVIVGTHVREPKCLNRSVGEWSELICGRSMISAQSKGKWCEMLLAGGVRMRLNLGMGGEFLIHEPDEELPGKYRILLALEDGKKISVNFWWFGSLHAVRDGEEHKAFDSLGTDALEEALNEVEFRRAYCGRRAAIKTLLLDQRIIAGVGNYYSHDIFFEAGIHPMKKACDLTEHEYGRLYRVIRETFIKATEARGAYYEKDLFNQPGGWDRRLIAYRKGEKCPVCGTEIEEIRTGATAGFICPACQKM